MARKFRDRVTDYCLDPYYPTNFFLAIWFSMWDVMLGINNDA